MDRTVILKKGINRHGYHKGWVKAYANKMGIGWVRGGENLYSNSFHYSYQFSNTVSKPPLFLIPIPTPIRVGLSGYVFFAKPYP